MTEPTPDQAAARVELEVLSKHELEVMLYASKGFSVEETAGHLSLSGKTVQARRTSAAKALDMNVPAMCCLIGRAGLA